MESTPTLQAEHKVISDYSGWTMQAQALHGTFQ